MGFEGVSILTRWTLLRTLRSAAFSIAAAALCAPFVADAQTLPTLRVALIPAEAAGQVYFAKEMGFFEKAGLNVEVQTIGNTNAIAAAVASNGADVGFSAILSIATAYKKGIPFTIVAAGNQYESSAPIAAIVVAQNSPIRSAKDLNGKTIGANAVKSISEYAPRAWIDKNGGDSATVKFLELQFSAMPDAVAAGRIDAEWLTEPFLAAGKKNGRVLAYAFDAIAKEFLISGWFASAPWAKEHPDLVARFAVAMRDAARWANANQDKSGAILVNAIKIDPAVFATVVRTRFADHLSAADVQPQIDLAAHYGLFAQTFPAAELIYSR
jgi:NitT/TauT family transport system substrate-binding protein